MYETVNLTTSNEHHSSVVTTEDHGLGARVEDFIQNPPGPQLTNANTHRYPVPSINTSTSPPMSPIYRIILDREVEMLFGAANHATHSTLVPLNDVIPVMEEHSLGAVPKAVTRTPRSVHSCLAVAPCQWTVGGGSEACSDHITCKSVSAHFKNTHNIRRLRADTLIRCQWKGCPKQIKRKNFVRHICECHLGHLRETKYTSRKRSLGGGQRP
ncbi:hypothetical protein HD554DRAFT_2038787 [Boletus coccyginus]|nr:hypothetical protein HD554DRAFT_2038787 [Boletus coccyginus]